MRKLLQNVIGSAIREGADITWAPHYCEPGYWCDEDGVFFANWNHTDSTGQFDTRWSAWVRE